MFSWVQDPNITELCALNNVSGWKHMFSYQNGRRNAWEMFEKCKYFRI